MQSSWLERLDQCSLQAMTCCGKKSETSDIPPLLHETDCRYQVGGRYEVARPLDLWSGQNLDGSKIEVLQKKDQILLIQSAKDEHGRWFGLVVPQPAEERSPGWISLQESPDKQPKLPLQPKPLQGSWEMRARYAVQYPCTVRSGQEVESQWLAELDNGHEVLILELGVSAPTKDEPKARLRALISCNDLATEVVGWLSPETTAGDRLLIPVDLLSRKVVDLHTQSLRNKERLDPTKPAPKKSYQAGGDTPWKVGGTYRILEKVPARKSADLVSAEVFKVAAGALVVLTELHNEECPMLGWCPVACITVEDGPAKGKQGWVRCVAKDGHDLMDTRDHNEYDKVLDKMRRSSSSLPDASPAEMQALIVAMNKASEPEKEAEPESNQQEQAKSYAMDAFRESLQDKAQEKQYEAPPPFQEITSVAMMEQQDDDRLLIDHRKEPEDSSVWCGCACVK